ncbi:hypothetical protein, partial [Agrobacterium sp.]|uniref:hypothetical protein n=1 Tax=Agrobacterium sp. TaxID=361 RepID=UPI0028A5F396
RIRLTRSAFSCLLNSIALNPAPFFGIAIAVFDIKNSAQQAMLQKNRFIDQSNCIASAAAPL